MKTIIAIIFAGLLLLNVFFLGKEAISYSAFFIVTCLISVASLVIVFIQKCTVDIMTALANIAKYQIRREMENNV